MPRKAFITGINGFTGSHMAELLINNGLIVGGLVKNDDNLINISHIQSKIRKFTYDLSSPVPESLIRIFAVFSPDYVFHFASPILRDQKIDPINLSENLKVDFYGTLNLLRIISRQSKKLKVLITGTNAVYQPNSGRPLQEADRVNPLTSYGLSKFIQETSSLAFCRKNNLPLIVTRTFHLLGPRQKPTFVVSDFAKQIAAIEMGLKKPILNIGNAMVSRDFTDVRDAVRAYWLLMTQGKVFDVYNICSQKTKSIKEIINFYLSRTKVKIKINQQQIRTRKDEPDRILGNNHKIKKLGWQPEIFFKQS